MLFSSSGLFSFKPDSESVLSQSDIQSGYNANARRFTDADLSFRRFALLLIEFEFVVVNLPFVLVFCFNSSLSINFSDGPIISVESLFVSIIFKSV